MTVLKFLALFSLIVYWYAMLSFAHADVDRSKTTDAGNEARRQKGDWHHRKRNHKDLAEEFVEDTEFLKDLLSSMQRRVNSFDKPMLKKFRKLEKEAIKLLQEVEGTGK